MNHTANLAGKHIRIVVLDGFTLNPGDLSWDGLTALGECEVFARTPPELVLERARDATAVLTNKTVLNRQTLEELPRLKYLGVLATGYNVVDLPAARERGVIVTNVPDYGTTAVAQMTFALLLELAHRVGHHAQTVRAGRWCQSADFCYWDYPLIELAGLTLGVVGLGRIGKAVAALGQAFGMNIVAYTEPPQSGVPGVAFIDLDEVFRVADVLSLHCPLTRENQGMVNARRLALMKRTAFLLNTSRGPLVDETALAGALNRGELAGAALDVLAIEPPRPENPLLQAVNCLITPHIAWAARAARARLLQTVVDNLRGFLAGHPQNVV